MDKETREALEGSIAKWQAIVAGVGGDNGTENCPLCQLFNNDEKEDFDSETRCKGCPVEAHVGKPDCARTPYDNWGDVHHGWRPWKAETDEQKQAAQEELDFLISLRPKD